MRDGRALVGGPLTLVERPARRAEGRPPRPRGGAARVGVVGRPDESGGGEHAAVNRAPCALELAERLMLGRQPPGLGGRRRDRVWGAAGVWRRGHGGGPIFGRACRRRPRCCPPWAAHGWQLTADAAVPRAASSGLCAARGRRCEPRGWHGTRQIAMDCERSRQHTAAPWQLRRRRLRCRRPSRWLASCCDRISGPRQCSRRRNPSCHRSCGGWASDGERGLRHGERWRALRWDWRWCGEMRWRGATGGKRQVRWR